MAKRAAEGGANGAAQRREGQGPAGATRGDAKGNTSAGRDAQRRGEGPADKSANTRKRASGAR
ncbi:hypothetical protein C3R44_24320, partial [Mycobacterium tuberculosis]